MLRNGLNTGVDRALVSDSVIGTMIESRSATKTSTPSCSIILGRNNHNLEGGNENITAKLAGSIYAIRLVVDWSGSAQNSNQSETDDVYGQHHIVRRDVGNIKCGFLTVRLRLSNGAKGSAACAFVPLWTSCSETTSYQM